MRIILFAALAALATPVLAAAPAHHFTRDGQSYDYTAERAADGTVLISGTVDGEQPFALHVNGRDVAGQIDGTEVAFTASKDTIARLAQEVPADAGTEVASASLGR